MRANVSGISHGYPVLDGGCRAFKGQALSSNFNAIFVKNSNGSISPPPPNPPCSLSIMVTKRLFRDQYCLCFFSRNCPAWSWISSPCCKICSCPKHHTNVQIFGWGPWNIDWIPLCHLSTVVYDWSLAFLPSPYLSRSTFLIQILPASFLSHAPLAGRPMYICVFKIQMMRKEVQKFPKSSKWLTFVAFGHSL